MRVQRQSARVSLGETSFLGFGWAGSLGVCTHELLEGRHTLSPWVECPLKAQQVEARGSASPWRSPLSTASGKLWFCFIAQLGWQEAQSAPHHLCGRAWTGR